MRRRYNSKNTYLARRLAKLYEDAYERPFPGGVTNAKIHRDQLAIRAYKDAGSWIWSLSVIEGTDYNYDFGSPWPATKCIKDISKIECGFGIPAFT